MLSVSVNFTGDSSPKRDPFSIKLFRPHTPNKIFFVSRDNFEIEVFDNPREAKRGIKN